jgi:hypothetical protein
MLSAAVHCKAEKSGSALQLALCDAVSHASCLMPLSRSKAIANHRYAAQFSGAKLTPHASNPMAVASAGVWTISRVSSLSPASQPSHTSMARSALLRLALALLLACSRATSRPLPAHALTGRSQRRQLRSGTDSASSHHLRHLTNASPPPDRHDSSDQSGDTVTGSFGDTADIPASAKSADAGATDDANSNAGGNVANWFDRDVRYASLAFPAS